jgi:hypothetical protein
MKKKSARRHERIAIREIKCEWDVALDNCHIRFEHRDNYLMVDVVSMLDFNYYYGRFCVAGEKDVDDGNLIPQKIVESNLLYGFQSLSFKKGLLCVDVPSELSRYAYKFCFPEFQQM